MHVGAEVRKREVFRVNWIFELRIRDVDTWAQPTLTELSRYQSVTAPFLRGFIRPCPSPPEASSELPGWRAAPQASGCFSFRSGGGRGSGRSPGERAQSLPQIQAPRRTWGHGHYRHGTPFHPNSEVHCFFKSSMESGLSPERGGLLCADSQQVFE